MMVLLSLLLSKVAEMGGRTWKTAVDAYGRVVPPSRRDPDTHPPPAWFKYPPIS
jgi:hypothetical protein